MREVWPDGGVERVDGIGRIGGGRRRQEDRGSEARQAAEEIPGAGVVVRAPEGDSGQGGAGDGRGEKDAITVRQSNGREAAKGTKQENGAVPCRAVGAAATEIVGIGA